MTGHARERKVGFSTAVLVLLFSLLAAPVSAQGELSPSWTYPTGSEIRSMAMSTDGLYFAVGSTDHTVYYFTRDGKLLWSYTAGDNVNSVAVTADGQFVAAGSDDKNVYYFSRTGKLLWSHAASLPVRSVAVSGNGQFVAAGSRDRNVMYFSQDGTLLWSFPTGNYVNSVAVSSDGKSIVAGAWDKSIYYFGIDGSLHWSFTTGGDQVNFVSVSSDGQTVAATSADNKIYYLTGKGRLVWSYDVKAIVSDLALSRDGQYVVAGALDNQVYFLSRDGRLLWNYPVGNTIKSVEISDNGQYIAAGSQGNTVYSFRSDGNPAWISTAAAPIGVVTVSGNGQYVAAGSLTGIVYQFNNLAEPAPVETGGSVVPDIVTKTPLPVIAGGVVLIIVLAAGAYLYVGKRRRDGRPEDFFEESPDRPAGSGSSEPVEKIPAEWWQEQIPPGSDIEVPTMERVLDIATEVSREGREGKHIGTAFLVGDSENVMVKSRQLIKNPVEGHAPEDRLVTNPDQKEYIKEMAQLDGAFVISGNGLIEAVGRRITVDTSGVRLPDGYGTRHTSVAGMTQVTRSIGIVVSQSGGKISVFKNGKIIRVIRP